MKNTKSINRRSFLSTGATAAVAAAATGLGAPAVIASPKQKIKWTMQTHWPSGNWYYSSIFEALARRINEATNGELEIETHQPNSIVSTTDVLRGLRRGTLDAALLYPAYWVGDIPAAGHLNGNFGTWGSLEDMQFFLHDMGALEIIREAYATRGVHQVGPIANGGTALYSNKKLVTPEDFEGFKVRSNGSSAQVFEKMGAAPVSITGGELYQALQTGVVDGAHWGGVSAGWGMNLQEVTKYIIQPNLAAHQNSEVIVSMKSWEKLGNDFKKIVEDAVLATHLEAAGMFLIRDLQRMQDFQTEYQGEIVHMNSDAIELMRAKSLEVVDEISKRDPEYSGKIGSILHEFMKLTGKV
ncbi:TRAP transporter substrate-binding protein DctP [Marinobacter adhaerens]|uniref:TRAP transporter substrate-binding protein DctP n=1 Tax=Marinobacter adhaerens TaxID=1033846 RepID=A0A851HSC6_9GAMM|nr:TRAP transporter substrate-binding protein [Marinobacter adhaerens]NWN91877.1 TRAP transporter substrate-binding protein DctP [Marinobacter adhaerens]